jgi:hypothetical protein
METGEPYNDYLKDKTLMYMDDGLLFGTLSEFDLDMARHQFSWSGSEINPDKSK